MPILIIFWISSNLIYKFSYILVANN